MLSENPVYVCPEVVGSKATEVIAPADTPKAVSSDALIRYCVLAPPHDPGKNEAPVDEELVAPAPNTAVPGATSLLIPVKVMVDPLQTIAGVAVAEVIDGRALTTTLTVFVAIHAPAVAVSVYTNVPVAVGVMDAGLPLTVVVAPLPVVAHCHPYV